MPKTLRRAGQVKMRGKKTMLMRCKCCVCRDLRGDLKKKMAALEMRLDRVERDTSPHALAGYLD